MHELIVSCRLSVLAAKPTDIAFNELLTSVKLESNWHYLQINFIDDISVWKAA